ncbi:MAG: hypothetical protein WC300_05695 [Candidatus Omnitrophota bacterium]
MFEIVTKASSSYGLILPMPRLTWGTKGLFSPTVPSLPQMRLICRY